jgi:hypothetical protein
MLCLSYYCLSVFYNKIGGKGREVLPGSEGSEGDRDRAWGKGEK